MDSATREALVILLVIVLTFAVTVASLRRKAKRNKTRDGERK